jgi:two-component system, cell cycle sensor histidine kinase and response regulator CckA
VTESDSIRYDDISGTEQDDSKRESLASRLVENSQDIFFRISIPDGRFEYINRAVETITGYPPEVFYRDSTIISRIIHPDFHYYLQEEWNNLLAGVEPPHYEYKIVTRTGDIKWVEHRNMLFRSATGEIIAIDGTITEITTRKNTIESLRKSEERLRMFAENSRDVFFRFTIPDGEYEYINNAVETITGYSPEEFYNDKYTIVKVMHPDSYPAFEEAWGRLRAGIVDPVYEFKVITRSGEIVWGEQRNVPIYDERGNLIALEGTISDITIRKNAEVALRANEQYLSTTLQSIGDAVITTDRNGQVIQMNSVAQSLTGWTSQDARGHALADVFHVVDSLTGKPPVNAIQRVLNDGLTIGLTDHTLLISKTGIRYHIAENAAPITAGNGDIAGIVLVFRDITEHYEQEQALRLSEERNRIVSEMISDYVYSALIKPDGTSFTEWISGAFTHITGYTLDDINALETGWQAIIHEEDRVPTVRVLGALLDGGSVVVEYRILTRSGKIRWLRDFVRPVSDAGSGSIRFIGAVQDITRQKESESKLHFLGSIAEQVSDSIIITDTSHHITYLNTSAEKLFGYQRNELLGKTPMMLNARPDNREVYEHIFRTISSGNTWRGDVLDKRKNGEIFFCESEISPMYDEEGVIIGYIDIQRDVSERRRTEQALRDTTALLETLFNAIPDYIGVIDCSMQIIHFNKAFCERFGIPSDQKPGSYCYTAMGHEEPCEFCAVREVIQKTAPICHERYDRTLRAWLDVRAYPIIGQNGRVERIIEHIRDISEEKRAEKRRKKLEDQLAHAQKMETVGRLAGGIAHDFNNILTVIIGNTDLALASIPAENSIADELREIKSIAGRATNLIHQLLAFSRNQIIKTQLLNLNDTIVHMDRMVRRLIGEHIELVVLLDDDLWAVKIDPGQIEQVITNIVINARDAMPHGGKLVIETMNTQLDELYAESHPGIIPGEYVMITISDNGSGMDKRTLANVFEPFFTTKEKGKGTGLGLATCYGIVKQNNGLIWIYSEPASGTTVKVYFPRSEGVVNREKPVEEYISAFSSHETILVVEDEPSLLKMVSRMLGGSGYTVMTADNGEEAIRILEQYHHEIHLVLTDMVMPRMGGKELAERISETYPHIPIIFMSGYTDQSILHRGILQEGVTFIQKPFSAPVLLKCIRNTLDNTRSTS